MNSPRPSLSDRLQSLVSRAGSPVSENEAGSDQMRTAVSAATKVSRTAAGRSSPSPSSSSAYQQLPAPVLRWLNGGNTPPSTESSQPRAVTANSHLEEALRDDLVRPDHASTRSHAHPPEHFRPSRQLSRPPPFFDNLTRSTLPTASLSNPDLPAVPLSASSRTPPTSPSFLRRHPDRRASSVDTLKSLQARSLHTTSPQSISESPPNNRWWLPSAFSKSDVDPLLDESDRQADTPQEEQHIRSKYRRTENPVVFCHGLLGFDMVSIGPSIAPLQVTHWRGIREALDILGTEVLMARVPATSAPAERAQVLARAIAERFPGKKVHLIGHSMGGLDCRYLTTHLAQDLPFDVLSVTTIATPHRGSAFADYFLGALGASRLPSVLSLIDMLPNGGGSGQAFEALTLENMKKFNEETPDVDGVEYFSWGAWYEPGLIDTWRFSHGVVLEQEGPNDGLVSIESSKWGTYLGTLENVSHLDLIGWTNTARYAWAEAMGRAISFKPATFYLGVVDHLARVVEGGEEPAPSSPQAARELDKKTGQGVQIAGGEGQVGRAEPKRAMSGDAQTPEEQGAETTARRSVDAGATRRRTGPGKKRTDDSR